MSIFVPILALFSNSWIFNGFMSVIFYVNGKVLYRLDGRKDERN